MTMLGADTDSVVGRIEELLDEKKVLERKNRELKIKTAMSDIEGNIVPRAVADGVELIMEKFDDITPDLLRQIGDRIRQKRPAALSVLAATSDAGGVVLTAMASDEAIKKGAHAGLFLKKIAEAIGGKGGGKPNLAQGGAPDASKLQDAFAKAPEFFADMMKNKG